MRKRLICGSLLAVIAGTFGPGIAAAEAAPCTASQGSYEVRSVYSRMTFGRKIAPKLSLVGNLPAPGIPVVFTFAAADPARPISNPLSVAADPYGDPVAGTVTGPPIGLEKGDGPGVLTINWSETVFPFPTVSCERTVSFLIEGTPKGKRPKFGFATSGNRTTFVDRSCLQENMALPGQVRVTVSGEGKTRSAKLVDQCESRWRPARADAGPWELADIGDYLRFVSHAGLGLGKHLFRVRIRFRGKIIDQYVLEVVVAIRYLNGA